MLCVTHLPQVASQGQRHYRVVKLTDGKTSRTEVRPLSSEERVEELSRMLGGIEITERTRAHAAEMIERAGQRGLASGFFWTYVQDEAVLLDVVAVLVAISRCSCSMRSS